MTQRADELASVFGAALAHFAASEDAAADRLRALLSARSAELGNVQLPATRLVDHAPVVQLDRESRELARAIDYHAARSDSRFRSSWGSRTTTVIAWWST